MWGYTTGASSGGARTRDSCFVTGSSIEGQIDDRYDLTLAGFVGPVKRIVWRLLSKQRSDFTG